MTAQIVGEIDGHIVYQDSNGEKYYLTVDWVGNNPRVMTVVVQDEREEYEARVMFDEDIARLLCWFEAEDINDGSIFDFWMCNDCGEFFDEEPQVIGENNVCDGCAEDYGHCDKCGAVCSDDDLTEVADGSFVCESCLDAHYTACHDCGRYFLNSDYRMVDDDISICRECSYSWFVCDDCGCICHENDACCNDRGVFCERCYENNCDECDSYGIHDYGYRPTLNFHGDATLYFGTEMEIDYGNFDRFNFNVLNPLFYACSDGSLDEGFEIISHPMTYDYIMENTPYDAVCAAAKSAGFKSHDTNTCGFHIHMTRDAFGERYGSAGVETDKRITSFVYFFEKFWPQMVKFSRRKGDDEDSQIRHYAARMLDDDEPVTMENVCKQKDKKGFSRYHCVNLSNHDTIEVRIFQGTINPQTIIASIQLCKLFYELSVFDVNAIEHMTWEQIKKYAETDYPELLAYMAKRNL